MFTYEKAREVSKTITSVFVIVLEIIIGLAICAAMAGNLIKVVREVIK